MQHLKPTKEQVIESVRVLKRIGKKIKVKNNIKEFITKLMYDTFLRERYNKRFHEDMPCYIGWFYSIVDAAGNVRPCCGRPHTDVGLGNIKDKEFYALWHSLQYDTFRAHAHNFIKSKEWLDTYCSYYCMNNVYNDFINKFIHPIASFKRYVRIRTEIHKELSNNGAMEG